MVSLVVPAMSSTAIKRWWLLAVIAMALTACTSIDASTSKALDACEKIEDEATRADCIVRVSETDPHRG